MTDDDDDGVAKLKTAEDLAAAKYFAEFQEMRKRHIAEAQAFHLSHGHFEANEYLTRLIAIDRFDVVRRGLIRPLSKRDIARVDRFIAGERAKEPPPPPPIKGPW
jgi:hypothetical protein